MQPNVTYLQPPFDADAPAPHVPREVLGRAAYEAALKRPDLCVSLPWDDVLDDERADWTSVAEAVLSTAGLDALAEDVLAEREAVDTGIVEAGGAKYLRDPKGALIPLGMVKPQRLLEDEMVRKIMRFALDLSAQVARFKGHTFADLAAFQSLLEQQYGAKAGGPKGNVSFTTFDDSMRIEVKIADLITFGAELQAAKKLVDECLEEWGADSHEAIRALVNRVFSVGKEGQINRAELFSLLAMEVEDPRWQRGMEAIRDSIRVIGTKAYLRFRIRDEAGALGTVTIDLAAA
jgi:hypothetical protein